MVTASHFALQQQIQNTAAKLGLRVSAAGVGTDFSGAPTSKLELTSAIGARHSVEIGEAFASDAENRPELVQQLDDYLQTLARRMQSPRPDVFLTLHGLPLSMQQFSWPYHRSTSGADSFILHGVAQLAMPENPLHARVAASLTVTLAEVLPALEQPYAEGVTFNAIRKTLDLGQLELLKSGNRQPVPVGTRYYSFRHQRFIFSDTGEGDRKNFLRAKIYWIGARLAPGTGVWIADPYDAQYLDCSGDDLRKCAQDLAAEGLIALDSSAEYATATAKLTAQGDEFTNRIDTALASLKPKFNEEMRAGHTNM